MLGDRFGRLVVIWEGLSSVGNDILPYPMPEFTATVTATVLPYPFGRINS